MLSQYLRPEILKYIIYPYLPFEDQLKHTSDINILNHLSFTKKQHDKKVFILSIFIDQKCCGSQRAYENSPYRFSIAIDYIKYGFFIINYHLISLNEVDVNIIRQINEQTEITTRIFQIKEIKQDFTDFRNKLESYLRKEILTYIIFPYLSFIDLIYIFPYDQKLIDFRLKKSFKAYFSKSKGEYYFYLDEEFIPFLQGNFGHIVFGSQKKLPNGEKIFIQVEFISKIDKIEDCKVGVKYTLTDPYEEFIYSSKIEPEFIK